MKKHLLVALMLSLSTLAACGGSSDAPKAPETKPAASAPAATPAPVAAAPAAPAPVAAPAAVAPAPVAAAPAAAAPVATGPLADLLKAACACTAPDCGTKAMGDFVALVSSGAAIDLQGPDVAQLSQCIMSTGIDKNEFISKMRQLRP